MARIGVAFYGGLAPGEIVDCVKMAEDLGYESAWMVEGHGGDQFAVLTACALATQRILLGTSISSVFVRSVPTIAMAAATVDHLSQRRFILGLGSSHKVQVEPEHGLPYGQPVQRVRDSVAIIRTLLRDGVVSYQGKTVSIERFDLWFTPIRQEIPIYLGAVFPKMLEVCGEIAQGAILVWRAGDRGAGGGAHHRGRATGWPAARGDRHSALLPCSVAANRQEAFDALRPVVAFYAGFFPRYHRLIAAQAFQKRRSHPCRLGEGRSGGRGRRGAGRADRHRCGSRHSHRVPRAHRGVPPLWDCAADHFPRSTQRGTSRQTGSDRRAQSVCTLSGTQRIGNRVSNVVSNTLARKTCNPQSACPTERKLANQARPGYTASQINGKNRVYRMEEIGDDASWHRQIYLRTHPGLSQAPLWGIVRDSQHSGDGFPRSRLCLPAQGPSSHGL